MAKTTRSRTYNVVFKAKLDTAAVDKEIKQYTSGSGKLNQATKTSTNLLGKLNTQFNNLGSTIGKVAKFGIATGAIKLFTDALRGSVDAVYKMDGALTELSKVSELSGEALKKYGDLAAEVGRKVARSGSEVVEAATTFVRAGFEEADALKLAELASMYTNVADSEISTADAGEFLISVMKAFDIEAANAMDILDKTNSVANNFAVSNTDLSEALQSGGASLATYGNDLAETIALITAGTEIMQNRSSQVARGLNTIASRLTKYVDVLADYGVDVYDKLTGNLRSTYDILADLAPKWEEMSDAERVALGNQLAGVNQYKVLTSVLENFDSALKANETANYSAGSATRENEKAMDSLELKTKSVSAELEHLGTTILSSGLVKALLDLSGKVLTVLNDALESNTVKLIAWVAAWRIVAKALSPTLLDTFGKFAYIVPIIAGLPFLIDENTERIKKLREEIGAINVELDNMQAEYDELSSKAVVDLTLEERERLQVLKEQLEILKAQKKEKQEKIQQDISLPSFADTGSETEMVGGGLGFTYKGRTQLIDTLKSLNDVNTKTREKLYETYEALKEVDEAGIQLDEDQRHFVDTYEMLMAKTSLASDVYKQFGDVIGGLAEKELDRLREEYGDNTAALKDLLNAEDAQELALQAVRNAAIEYINGQEGMQISTSATTDEIRKQLVALAQQAVAAANAYEAARIAAGDTKSEIARSQDKEWLQLQQNVAQASNALYALDKVLYKNTETTKDNSDEKDKDKDKTRDLTDATRELTSALKDQTEVLEAASEFMINRLQDEIDALEAQKQKIQDTNEALEEQIELEEALDALAKAKSRKVLVYKDGQFTYSSDASAISEAQKRVDELRREQRQKEAIAEIDKRIDAIKAEQDTWRDVRNAYTDYLGAQQLGVSVEGDAWKTRIGQAEEYAKEYLKIMQTVAGVESGSISLAEGKKILSSSSKFIANLPASTAYKSLLGGDSSSRIVPMSTAQVKDAIRSYMTTLNIADVTLPNVTNADKFVSELKNLSMYAIQDGTTRKV